MVLHVYKVKGVETCRSCFSISSYLFTLCNSHAPKTWAAHTLLAFHKELKTYTLLSDCSKLWRTTQKLLMAWFWWSDGHTQTYIHGYRTTFRACGNRLTFTVNWWCHMTDVFFAGFWPFQQFLAKYTQRNTWIHLTILAFAEQLLQKIHKIECSHVGVPTYDYESLQWNFQASLW